MPDQQPAGRVCPFCALPYGERARRCPRCGKLLPAAIDEIRGRGEEERRRLRARKTRADLLFLLGLLLGGPAITVWDHPLAGACMVLAGGAASLLLRHTSWSTAGAVVAGVAAALAVAAWVFDPTLDAVEDTLATEAARASYVEAIAAHDPDLYVEARGPALVAVWFTLPEALAGECGDYPDARVRRHLAELGFRRVVVQRPNGAGGLCSFPP